MTDESKGAPETIDMPKAIWMQLDVQYHRLASWDLIQWCDTAFTTGTEYTLKATSDKRIAEARKEALEEAKAACAEYKQGHTEVMKKHGNSDYHVSAAAAATRCINAIEALKADTP